MAEMTVREPAVEGLLLGKRLVYSSRLRAHAEPWTSMPGLVAESDEEFEALFARALEDRDAYPERHGAAIALLGPFRDGATRRRIHAVLGMAEAC